VNTALTRYIALWRSEGRHGDVQVLVRAGLTFKAAVAGAMALCYWAGTIASVYLQRPELEALVRIVSLGVLGTALMTATQAVLVGYEKMGYRSLTQVLWTLLRGSISVTLVWLIRAETYLSSSSLSHAFCLSLPFRGYESGSPQNLCCLPILQLVSTIGKLTDRRFHLRKLD